jgi:hypothetical protein
VRKECWVPKPFHGSKQSVGIYLDDPLSAYCSSVRSFCAPFARVVAMRPVREYSFYRGRIGSCALAFAVPGSAVDGAHMIDATWYQDYTERTTNSILQFRKGSSRSEDTLLIRLQGGP